MIKIVFLHHPEKKRKQLQIRATAGQLLLPRYTAVAGFAAAAAIAHILEAMKPSPQQHRLTEHYTISEPSKLSIDVS